MNARLSERGDADATLVGVERPSGAHRVSVVIPTLNEEQNLPHIIPRLASDHEVVLVDGQSEDGTVAAALALRASIKIVEQNGRGKGHALEAGFAAATGDIIVTLDADGSTNPEEIPKFVAALLAGADYVKGSRFLPGGGSEDITPLRALGNWGLARLVNLLFRTRYTDLCYGYNAFWTDVKPYIARDVPGFEVETAMNVRAAKAGLKVVEVASREGSRLHGVSKLNTFKDGWRVLRTILRERIHSPHSTGLAEALTARAERAAG